MRKLVVLGVLALAAGAVPAHAADPYCTITDANLGKKGTVGAACTFTADANPHGYVLATPNDVRIFLDVDGDGNFEPANGDTQVALIEPTSGHPVAGPLTLTTGSNYTMQMLNGCAGPTCGHIGFAAAK